MSQYNNQDQIPGRVVSALQVVGGGGNHGRGPSHRMAYPPPAPATAYMAPPPPGYPTRDGQQPAQSAVPIETKTRGGWGRILSCCGQMLCCCMDISSS